LLLLVPHAPCLSAVASEEFLTFYKKLKSIPDNPSLASTLQLEIADEV
jgi:hypothetical protein